MTLKLSSGSKYIVVVTIAIVLAIVIVSFNVTLPSNNTTKTVTILMIVSIAGILECEVKGDHKLIFTLFSGIAGFVLGSS